MKVGDSRSCPNCRGKGKVVWISEDGKTIAVKCSRVHLGKKIQFFSSNSNFLLYVSKG